MKTFIASLCLTVLLCGAASAQIEAVQPIERTFKLNQTDLPPETRTDLVMALEPGFTEKAGGDLFIAKFGRDRFRYEYQSQWIEFEPLNHVSLSLASAANELYYTDYWPDANLRFTVRDYGVKVDIILMSDAAPQSYSFRVSKSAKWEDVWIKPPFAYRMTDMLPVGISGANEGGILTYTLDEKTLAGFEYPLVVDPSFYVTSGVDDAYSHYQDGGGDSNQWAQDFIYFGTITIASNGRWQGFFRWAVDLPRASKVSASTLEVHNIAQRSTTFDTYFYRLYTDDKWETSDGFNDTSYATGTALEAIPMSSEKVYLQVTGTWYALQWFETPELKTLIQLRIDDLDYDPTDSENMHVGLHWSIDAVSLDWYVRNVTSYEDSGANVAKLNIAFDPWAEVTVHGGFRLDSDGLRYYGWDGDLTA